MKQFMNRKERRKHKRGGNKFQKPQVTMIGQIVDLSLEDFEKELVRQKVNIGTINNLILNLEAVYFDMRTRKDAVIKASFEGTIDKTEAQKAVNGLYAEMIKVEQKITYLKQRSEELINVDKTPN